MAEKEKKIRIHNKGKRIYIIPSASGKGKSREIQPGRAVDIEESTALKYLKNYPRDLVRYDSLVSDDDKKANSALKRENAALKKKLAALEANAASSGETDSEGAKESDASEETTEESTGEKKSGLAAILSGKKE